MASSVLSAHQVTSSKKGYFDISGIFFPHSIKDQVIRATLVIDEAIREGVINSKTGIGARPLLIVGGGFAGVTAAIKASFHEIPTYLVEQNYVLNKFSNSRRLVYPNLYDWSLPHWNSPVFPWNKSRTINITWKEGSILSVAQAIQSQLLYAQQNYPLYSANLATCRIKSTGKSFNRLGNIFSSIFGEKGFPMLDAEFVSKDSQSSTVKFVNKGTITNPISKKFGMVLTCLGMGEQRISLPENYKGFDFWTFRPEKFRSSNLKVLIVGAGDGGLQDFILLSTKVNSVKTLYELVSKNISDSLRDKIESEVAIISDMLRQQSSAHGVTDRLKCKAYTDAQNEFIKLVDEVFIEDKKNKISICLLSTRQ